MSEVPLYGGGGGASEKRSPRSFGVKEEYVGD